MAAYDEAWAALGTVVDPELDEPITDLGFVSSLVISRDGGVEAHLRLPTAFCAPNFAYLMASDAKDALTALEWTAAVTVELDGHHDSDIINAGLAADAGYRGTFAHEADRDLEDLRTTFKRKAHTAAMERALTALLREHTALSESDTADVRLEDLPDNDATAALLRRRAAIGLPNDPQSAVLVDHDGLGYSPNAAALALRRARATRISIDGNAHFCRGLLRTRYADEPDSTFIPLASLAVPAAV